jgi:RNA polymerase sigma-70 factor, ECF subfamily
MTASPDRALELERLYRDEGARIWRALVAQTGDREIAADAVAEAFAQVIRRGEKVRAPGPWLWRAAFRIAMGELRERDRRQPLEAQSSVEMTEPPTDLLRALARLSPNQRAATLLRYYAGYSTREIAGILGANPATVRVHLSHGRRRLRGLLEDTDA